LYFAFSNCLNAFFTSAWSRFRSSIASSRFAFLAAFDFAFFALAMVRPGMVNPPC